MIRDLLPLAPVLLGHACLVVLAINALHGVGIRGHWPNKITYAFLVVTGVAGLVLAWSWLRGDSWPWPLRGYAWLCGLVGGLGLPIVTAVRLLRPRVPGVSGRDHVLDLAAEHGVDRLIGDCRRARLMRPSWSDALRLQCHEWEVELPRWPEALDGLSITQLTDLHMSPIYQREFFERVFHEAGRWDSDLVVFTGDLIESNEALPWVESLFPTVKGRIGTLAILGNHDILHDDEALKRSLAHADVTEIDGSWREWSLNGVKLAVGGTSAPWGPRLPLDLVRHVDATVVLSHTPDLFPWLARKGVDLVLSGHNHGGQIRLPVIGPMLMPSVYSRRYDQGFFRKDDATLYVSRGIGGANPVRYRCPIEITRLVLRSPKRQGRGTRQVAQGAIARS